MTNSDKRDTFLLKKNSNMKTLLSLIIVGFTFQSEINHDYNFLTFFESDNVKLIQKVKDVPNFIFRELEIKKSLFGEPNDSIYIAHGDNPDLPIHKLIFAIKKRNKYLFYYETGGVGHHILLHYFERRHGKVIKSIEIYMTQHHFMNGKENIWEDYHSREFVYERLKNKEYNLYFK